MKCPRLIARLLFSAGTGLLLVTGCFGSSSSDTPDAGSPGGAGSSSHPSAASSSKAASTSSSAASSATSSPTSGMQPGLLGPYTTKGNQILDKNGTPHFFRGLDRPGLETSCTANIQFNEYSVMNSWGANVVRLPVAQDCWLNDPSNPSYDPQYAMTVDDQVQAAMQNNMDIILDLHGSDQGSYSVGQTCLTGSRNCEQTLPDQHSVLFWQQVAAKYASSPNVIFELYNEPHPGAASPSGADWSSWLNGNTCSTSATSSQCGSGVSPGYTAVGMQALYNAVRNAPASAPNIVIIGGLNWAYDLSLVSSYTIPNATNVVYNTHPYSNKTANQGPAAWQTAFGSLAATYPVIATEFGFLPSSQMTEANPSATDCDSSYDTMFTQYANQQGPSPTPMNMLSWTAWAFYFAGSGECNYPSLIYDTNYDPNAPGLVVQTALQTGIP